MVLGGFHIQKRAIRVARHKQFVFGCSSRWIRVSVGNSPHDVPGLRHQCTAPPVAMHKAVTRMIKILLAVIAAMVVFGIALPSTLSYYDSNTRQQLLGVAAQELAPRASNAEMLDFMRRHTTRFAFDEKYQHQYSGFVPQTKLDRILFDRKVQVVLRVSENSTLVNVEVNVFYTGI
jgi:hypothetical protein